MTRAAIAASMQRPIGGPSMSHTALRIIRAEHTALAAMLRSILLLLAQHRQRGTLPDFFALRAMLFYVDEFPEKRHHQKESDLLFPALRVRTREAADVLDRLDRDHAQGERAIRDLQHDLLAFEMMGEPRRAAFERSAQNYVDFYLRHMALEEAQILPLAERCLSEQDWLSLDAAFEANRDPLAGHEPDEAYRALFTRIVNTLPPPLGLGPD
jgi:hemerythrin-like domain-containing protein